MEVMIPSPPVDFHFDSTSTSPFLTPPSSPPHPHFNTAFFSAPTSPSSSFHRLDTTFSSSSASVIPFSWESKPGTPKTKQQHATEFENSESADFEFDFFSGHLDRNSLPLSAAADELFHGGVIKPLKPPPRIRYNTTEIISNNAAFDSPKSPRSPTKFLKEALSPRHHHHKKNDFDPFEAAIEHTRRQNYDSNPRNSNKFDEVTNYERGRERTYNSSNSSSRRQKKGTRSLSPFRVCDIFAETHQEISSNPSASASSSKNWGWRGYKKWKLKDLLLFRSASEGRATTAGKDPLLKKYSLLKQSGEKTEEVKISSFRSTESSSTGSVSRRRGSGGGGPVSAHELHYTTNRAVSEEMRRKTFLPYNHGLLGCLGFNPAVHDISRGIGSVTRGP